MEDLTLGKKIHIGLFNQAQYMMSTIIASSLLIFYTDYIGLDNITIFGIAILVYGIWNAVNDPLFGYYSDRKISEGGLRKPLMRRGMPFMMLGFLLTILVVPGWEDWRIFIMLFTGLIIFDLGKALSMVNYGAYVITVANTPQKRSKLNMVVSYVGFIPGALIGIVPTVFLTGDFSYQVVLGVFLGISISFYIASRLSLSKMPESRSLYELNIQDLNENNESISEIERRKIKERLENEGQHILTLKESFIQTSQSKPFRYIVLYRFCATFFQGIYYQNLIYMLNWVIPAYGLWAIAISGIGGLTINALYPFLTKRRKKVGTIKVIKLCFMVAIPGYIIMFFTTSLWGLLVGYVLTTVALSGLYLFDPVLMGDVADDDFIKTGTHKQGIFCSVHGFFTTMAYSVAIFLLTLLLELFGYDGKATSQTASTILGIRITVTVLPVIAVILCIIILSKFPLQGKTYQELRFNLADVYGEDMLENDELLKIYRERNANAKDKTDEGIV